MNWRRLYPVRFDFFTAESFGSSEATPAAGFRERSAVVLQAVERLHGIISSTSRQNRNREFSLQPSNLKTAIQPRMDTVCISKSDFNKLAKTIDITMQIRSNSSLF